MEKGSVNTYFNKQEDIAFAYNTSVQQTPVSFEKNITESGLQVKYPCTTSSHESTISLERDLEVTILIIKQGRTFKTSRIHAHD